MTTSSNSEPNLIRYSGIRLAPERKAVALQGMAERIMTIGMPIVQGIFEEPWVLDDSLKADAPVDILKGMLDNGEFLLCYTPDNEELVMLLAFHSIYVNRFAHLLAYVLPNFRGQAIVQECGGQALEYAFKPAPDGLGLLKVKAEIAQYNKPSIAAAEKLGFRGTSLLQYEGLFRGQVCHMILAEIFNPNVFVDGEKLNGRTVESPEFSPVGVCEPVEPGDGVRPELLGDPAISSAPSVYTGDDPATIGADDAPQPNRRPNGRKRSRG